MPAIPTLNGQSFIPRLGQLLARQTGLRFHDVIQVCKITEITEPHWDAGEAIKYGCPTVSHATANRQKYPARCRKSVTQMHTA